jgi:hypothetical protein
MLCLWCAVIQTSLFPQAQACVSAWVKREFSTLNPRAFFQYSTDRVDDVFSVQVAADGVAEADVNKVHVRATVDATMPLAVWAWMGVAGVDRCRCRVR